MICPSATFLKFPASENSHMLNYLFLIHPFRYILTLDNNSFLVTLLYKYNTRFHEYVHKRFTFERKSCSEHV